MQIRIDVPVLRIGNRAAANLAESRVVDDLTDRLPPKLGYDSSGEREGLKRSARAGAVQITAATVPSASSPPLV